MSLNRMLALIAIVSIGLLVFGCTQPSTPQGAESAGGAQQQTTAAATQTPTQGEAAGMKLQGCPTGAGFTGLLSVVVPCECTVRVTTEAGVVTSKIFFLNNQYRMEGQMTAEGKTYNSIVISKNNAIYMDLNTVKQQTPEASILPCDWLKIEAQPRQGAPKPAVSENQLKQVPPADFTCAPATFGNEKFNTPGKICTLDDWMKALTSRAEIPSIPSE